jgi:hypothetical protein
VGSSQGVSLAKFPRLHASQRGSGLHFDAGAIVVVAEAAVAFRADPWERFTPQYFI